MTRIRSLQMRKFWKQTGGGFSWWVNVLDAEVPDAAPAEDDDAFPTDAVRCCKWFQQHKYIKYCNRLVRVFIQLFVQMCILHISSTLMNSPNILTCLILPKKSGLPRFCLECNNFISWSFGLAATQYCIKTNKTQIVTKSFDWNDNIM